MAKYSTGSSSGGGAAACELCGAESDSLRTTTVAGAQLEVCSGCASHGDDRRSERRHSGSESESRDRKGEAEVSRKKRAARNAARANPIWDGDSEHWETEGTNYDDDPLPYLVSGYGDVLLEARREAGYQRKELAEELDVREADLLAIEQDRATQAGVGGGLITALEDHLDVELSE